MTQHAWTGEELAILASRRAAGQSWDIIGQVLNISPKTCARIAREIGIAPAARAKPRHSARGFTPEEKAAIKRGRAAGLTWHQIGVGLNRRPCNVRDHGVRDLGLPSTLNGRRPRRPSLEPDGVRVPLPPGHPLSWGAITSGTLLEGVAYVASAWPNSRRGADARTEELSQ